MKRTPLKRKAAKRKRGPAVTCSNRQCRKRVDVEGFCTTHSYKEADRRFSLFIRARDGRCMAAGLFGLSCRGPLQNAHIIRRGSYKATLFDPENCVAMCKAHHVFVDLHQVHLDNFAEGHLGIEGYQRLKIKALHGGKRRDEIVKVFAWLDTEGVPV